LDLKLVLLGVLQDLANAAGRGAYAVHECLVLFALLVLGPSLAALIMVLANCGAQPARRRAFLHDSKRVIQTLARFGPNLTLGYVFVCASRLFADTTAMWALLVHEAGVLVALAVRGPARAVVLDILAGGLASLASDRAIANHKFGVLIALTSAPPSNTLIFGILALRRAKPAAGWADTKHGVRVGITLALLRPRAARCICIVARVGADAA